VGYAQRNFLVPIPRVNSWEELNGRLLEQCRERRARRLRGHQETIENAGSGTPGGVSSAGSQRV